MRYSLVVVLMMLVGGILGRVAAQDPSPTPLEAGVIFNQSAHVLFPSGLEFRLSLASPKEMVISGTLVLEQASGYRAEYALILPDPVTPAEGKTPTPNDVVGGQVDTTDIVKLITFTSPEDSPKPFEPINYRWEIETGGLDPQTSIVADQVLFQPAQTEEWQFLGEAPLSFTWYNANLGVAVLRDELLPIYDLLKQHTRLQPAFHFALFEADFAFCQAVTDPETNETRQTVVGNDTLPCQMTDYTDLLAQSDYLLVWTPQNDFDGRLNILLDQIFDGFYGEYWSGHTVPNWFKVGLGQFYRRSNGLQALAFAQNAAALDQLLPLNALASDPIEGQELLWRSQSYLFLLYLADQYGADTPFKVAQAIPDATTFDAAVETVTGQALTADYRAFLSWVDSSAAEVAALWNPYLPTTPTVTPSATATLVLPSRTPTNTPTASITPSSTSLIGRLPTIPTNTPTIPPIVTASNTPLPAGSNLPTVVPTAAPSGSNQDSGGSNLPCGGSALIVPALGAIVASRRRWRSV